MDRDETADFRCRFLLYEYFVTEEKSRNIAAFLRRGGLLHFDGSAWRAAPCMAAA